MVKFIPLPVFIKILPLEGKLFDISGAFIKIDRNFVSRVGAMDVVMYHARVWQLLHLMTSILAAVVTVTWFSEVWSYTLPILVIVMAAVVRYVYDAPWFVLLRSVNGYVRMDSRLNLNSEEVLEYAKITQREVPKYSLLEVHLRLRRHLG